MAFLLAKSITQFPAWLQLQERTGSEHSNESGPTEIRSLLLISLLLPTDSGTTYGNSSSSVVLKSGTVAVKPANRRSNDTVIK